MIARLLYDTGIWKCYIAPPKTWWCQAKIPEIAVKGFKLRVSSLGQPSSKHLTFFRSVSRQCAVGYSKKLQNHNRRYVPFILLLSVILLALRIFWVESSTLLWKNCFHNIQEVSWLLQKLITAESSTTGNICDRVCDTTTIGTQIEGANSIKMGTTTPTTPQSWAWIDTEHE